MVGLKLFMGKLVTRDEFMLNSPGLDWAEAVKIWNDAEDLTPNFCPSCGKKWKHMLWNEDTCYFCHKKLNHKELEE